MDPTAGGGTPEAVLAAFNQPGVMSFAVEGPDLTVTAASGSVAAFAGPGGMVGRPYAEAMPAMEGQGWGALFRQVMETAQPVGPGEWRVEVERPDEGVVVTYVSLTLRPWFADDGTVRGVLGHGFDVTDEGRRREDAETGEASAEQRYLAARDLVLALQDNLLPHALPVVPGLETTGRYLLSVEDTAAGGDWLDVVPLPSGDTVLVVGDVVGHGAAASATMGQLRAVLGERLRAGAGVGDALAALDAFAARIPEAHAATVAVVEVDVTDGGLRYCTAGHPPPLMITAGGESHYLEPSGAGPLGTGGGFPVAEASLGEQDFLLLYSDGIIERPGLDPAQATVELATVASRVVRGQALTAEDDLAVDQLCVQTLELLTRQTGYRDDITLLAARRVAQPEPLLINAQARPDVMRQVRRSMTDWLNRLRPQPLDEMALQHAVGECVTNVVDHAYLDVPVDGDRPVLILADLNDQGTVEISVGDRGRWRERANRGRERGRGLQMVNTMARNVTIDRGSDGTTVVMSCPVSRGVALMEGEERGGPHGRDPDRDPFSASESGGRLTVRGAVDGRTVEEFRAALLPITGGQLTEVTIDLSELTLLASAGVHALFAAQARAEDQGTALRLLAPPGSAAQHVLDLVGIPHDGPGEAAGSLKDLPDG